MEFETKQLADRYDALAPDGSEIRLLPALRGGSMAHCTLPPGQTSRAVAHRTVEEIWYVIEGQGQVWRQQGNREACVEVRPGASLTIPLGTDFQFRNTGPLPLRLIIITMPPWPGDHEAVSVKGHWPG